jgi:hypothetical protein
MMKEGEKIEENSGNLEVLSHDRKRVMSTLAVTSVFL